MNGLDGKTKRNGNGEDSKDATQGKAVSAVNKGVGLANAILLFGLLILYLIFLTKPLFYFTQSYCGGIFDAEEVMEICIEESHDLQRYEETNIGFQIIVGGASLFVFIALLNAVSCALRLYKNCPKSPVNKAVGSFCFVLPVAVLYGALKIVMDHAFKVTVEQDSVFTVEELAMFNVCDGVFWLGTVVLVLGLINIITSVKAKKEVE